MEDARPPIASINAFYGLTEVTNEQFEHPSRQVGDCRREANA